MGSSNEIKALSLVGEHNKSSFELHRAKVWIQKTLNAATATAFGFTATNTGTVSAQARSNGSWLRFATAATNGAVGGIAANTLAAIDTDWAPELTARIVMDSTNNRFRATLGFWNSTIDTIDFTDSGAATPTESFMGFQIMHPSTGGPSADQGIWVCVTCDGSDIQRTNTSVTVTAGNIHTLRIKSMVNINSTIEFYITNSGIESLVAVHRTGIHSGLGGFGAKFTNTAAATNFLEIDRLEISYGA